MVLRVARCVPAGGAAALSVLWSAFSGAFSDCDLTTIQVSAAYT